MGWGSVEVEGRALRGAAEKQGLTCGGDVVALALRDECAAVPWCPHRGGFPEKPRTLAVGRPLPDSFPERLSCHHAGTFT